jgi:hypothetical protein
MADAMAESVSLSPNLISCYQRGWLERAHLDRDGVVFIDNGYDAHGQQLVEGVLRVEISCPLP